MGRPCLNVFMRLLQTHSIVHINVIQIVAYQDSSPELVNTPITAQIELNKETLSAFPQQMEAMNV